MRKIDDLIYVAIPLLFILGIIAFLVFDTKSVNAAAGEAIIEKQLIDTDLMNLETEIVEVITNIKALPEAERSPLINERIKLEMEKYKLKAYSEAYSFLLAFEEQPTAAASSFSPGTLSAGETVPGEYIPIYKAAGEKYNIEWTVLAAIHKIETDFSRINTMISSVGALGHMQFMPPTWAYYGVDGNNDLRIDVWSLEDSIFSAANYLNASGFSKDIRKAIWHYNHAEWYVNDVIETAARFKVTNE